MWNKLYRILRLKTLTHRLFFWMFLFIALSVTVFLMLYTNVDKKARIDLANKRLEQSVEKQKVIVENWAKERIEEITYAATMPEVKEKRYEEASHFIQFYAEHLSEINALVVLDESGYVMIDSALDNPYFHSDVTLDDREYFKAAKNDEVYISDIITSKTNGAPVIIFSVPVTTDDHEFGGVVFASVSLSTIQTLLQNTTMGTTGNVLLVNPNGVPLQNVQHAENILTASDYTNLVQDAVISDEKEVFYKNNDGQQVTGKYISLFDERFFLIHEMEVEEILQTHDDVMQTVITLIIFIVIIGVILISIILWGILRSFVHFTEAIKVVNDGNYYYEIDENMYKQSPSEIQTMMDVFSEMTRTIEGKNRKLIQQSETDTLTGVYNRRKFLSMIEEAWECAYTDQAPIALAFIDIDFFKQLNDAFGHVGGDDILIMITNEIEKNLTHTNGTLFRYGGEEFVILFPQTDEQTAYRYAEKIRKQIERKDIRHGNGSVVTISVGITSMIPKEEKQSHELIEAADHALYQAKETGRNRVGILSEADHYIHM